MVKPQARMLFATTKVQKKIENTKSLVLKNVKAIKKVCHTTRYDTLLIEEIPPPHQLTDDGLVSLRAFLWNKEAETMTLAPTITLVLDTESLDMFKGACEQGS